MPVISRELQRGSSSERVAIFRRFDGGIPPFSTLRWANVDSWRGLRRPGKKTNPAGSRASFSGYYLFPAMTGERGVGAFPWGPGGTGPPLARFLKKDAPVPVSCSSPPKRSGGFDKAALGGLANRRIAGGRKKIPRPRLCWLGYGSTLGFVVSRI